MDALRQQPLFAFDHETRKQIRETRTTLLEHLRSEPDDFKALVIADVIGELDPDRDLVLARHRMHFRETRPADWKVRAKALGLDRLLFHLASGMRLARIGKDAIPVLERRAAEIGEARAAEVRPGMIDRSYVPEALASHATYYASGHLRSVSIELGENREGGLELAETPGSGHYRIIEMRGGYGTMINEDYRDGCVVTTLNTPWHDGEESSAKKPWTRWVEENLADLERLVTSTPEEKQKKRAKKSRKRR